MKTMKWISCFGLLLYCCTSCEGISDILYVRNDSDEAIYVYCICGDKDSLPSHPKLELFHFSSADMKDAYGNSVEPRFATPSYRINAYDIGSLKGGLEGRLWNTSSKKRLPCKENKMTLYFITEKTMRNYDWGDIHRNQLYVKKITLTEDELVKTNWLYVYKP